MSARGQGEHARRGERSGKGKVKRAEGRRRRVSDEKRSAERVMHLRLDVAGPHVASERHAAREKQETTGAERGPRRSD